MNTVTRNLVHAGGATLLLSAVLLQAPGARAQTPGADAAASNPAPDSGTLEEVVVTGTNIRGVVPVGANVITVSSEELNLTGAQVLGDMLRDAPALTNFGSETQGGQNAPNIHELGQSASTSTLTVLDGFRIPVGGTVHSLPDPSIIPTNAIQRVDVLADGSSSIYGSDAVAGVVNIITRNTYDGLEIDESGGFAKSAGRWNSGALWGHNWDSGNVMIAYEHSYLAAITLASRQSDANFLYKGGTNSDSFACNPATIQPASKGNYYFSAFSAANISTAQVNAPCFNKYGDNQPEDRRDNVMFKATEHFGSKLTVTATALYAINQTIADTSAATLTATAFGPGSANASQINPFYVNPPGVAATSQKILYNFNALLPLPISTSAGATDLYGHVEADLALNDNWVITAHEVYGQDDSYSYVYNGFCSSCALLALNGTANASGNLTTPDVLGTTIVNTQTLTAANALDVWDPVGSNKTSAATLASLQTGVTGMTATNIFNQARLGIDGSVFELPAGPVKGYLGGELYNNNLHQYVAKTNSTGPAVYGSGYAIYYFERDVASAFAEARIPVVSPSMGIPLVKKLDIDLSGRYDHYSDVGSTSNPKYAGTWQVNDWITLRGDYSTSFVAPQLDSIGDPSQQYRAAYGGAGGDQTLTTFPTALYPGTAGVLPGCAANAVTCQIGTASTPGFKEQRGIGPTAKPQVGNGWTFGVDFTPTILPGFAANLTLWSANFQGAVTSENPSVYANTGSLTYLLPIFPNGISPTSAYVQSKIAPFPTLNSSLPPVIYYFYGDDQLNIFNLYSTGLDYTVKYDFDTRFGHFSLGTTGTQFLKMDESFGYPTPGEIFSVKNSNGENSLFPDIETQLRTHAGWLFRNVQTDVYWNFTGGYRNWGANSVAPILHDSAGNPTGGGDWVHSNSTFDLNIAYKFGAGRLAGDQIYFHATNLFNTPPPFVNGPTGYDSAAANLVGRILEAGVRIKF
jgi:iron complex outermembrane receptor protein